MDANTAAMTVEELTTFCLTLPASLQKEAGPPANIMTFSVGGKNFAYFKTSEPEQWRFSIRVTPERFIELTDQPGVKPARYMHRFHWISIVTVAEFDADYLQELVQWSYRKAVSALPKKVQRDISVTGIVAV